MADWGSLVDKQEAALTSQVEGLNITKPKTTSSMPASTAISSHPTSGAGDGDSLQYKKPLVFGAPSTAAASTTTTTAATATTTTAAATTASASAAPSTEQNTSAAAAANAASGDAEEEKETTAEENSLLRKLLRSKLVTGTTDIEILRRDPNSPLHSVKSFEALNLHPDLLKGVYGMGFNAPSKIQETALPTLLADPPANMIAQSQSGTGKTAAFVLTMLSRADMSKNYTQCLCLAPTYELALQIGDVTKEMAKFIPQCSIGYAVRGERVQKNQKVPYQIVIGTPGTVMDWAIKMKAFDLKKIKVFVLDEADVMIATQGHQDQSLRIKRNLSADCQLLLFSATYDQEMMKFAQNVIPNNPVVIRLRREEESLDNIRQFYIECRSADDKFQALSNIYGSISIGQSMIFCQTRRNASWLAEKMTKEGHAVGILSGELLIEQRAAIIKRFRDGKEKVLITTNVSARGIDVETVTVVVNFDMPVTMDGQPDHETYLHRIGRTGRFGKSGLAINMVDNSRSMEILRSIERHFGRKIIKLDAEDIDEIEKIGT
ncbi:ATP-dependent RNA helicase DDX19A-like isoform X2 [Gigantopelta aegis]|nr:ATP-dependent RNA helicase DDX19A-like isoform X2 [Gigantopelta aegis]XP_041378192.1 ATP-dependent RNA helicase DDX19A-like isoform X2 [Gigantopelta aegis]